jgi:hypothetical protein
MLLLDFLCEKVDKLIGENRLPQQLVLKASLKHKSPFCCVQCWMESKGANHLDVDIELQC